jgi:hypothetical protein
LPAVNCDSGCLVSAEFGERIDKSDWSDVVALLPPVVFAAQTESASDSAYTQSTHTQGFERRSRFDNRATYGNPIDFRGLRHEPVNEQGVVFIESSMRVEVSATMGIQSSVVM